MLDARRAGSVVAEEVAGTTERPCGRAAAFACRSARRRGRVASARHAGVARHVALGIIGRRRAAESIAARLIDESALARSTEATQPSGAPVASAAGTALLPARLAPVLSRQTVPGALQTEPLQHGRPAVPHAHIGAPLGPGMHERFASQPPEQHGWPTPPHRHTPSKHAVPPPHRVSLQQASFRLPHSQVPSGATDPEKQGVPLVHAGSPRAPHGAQAKICVAWLPITGVAGSVSVAVTTTSVGAQGPDGLLA
jgi:hypothetical protein